MGLSTPLYSLAVPPDLGELVVCSDGVVRTKEDKDAFDQGRIKREWCGLRERFVDVRSNDGR